MELYQRHIEPSEPGNEWNDRNMLYNIQHSSVTGG